MFSSPADKALHSATKIIPKKPAWWAGYAGKRGGEKSMVNKIVTKAHVAEYSRGWPWSLDLFQKGRKVVVSGWAVPIDPSPSPARYRWAGHKPLFQKEWVWTLTTLDRLPEAAFTFDYEGESHSFVGRLSTLKTPPDDIVAKLCRLSVIYDGEDAILIPMDIVGMWKDD